MSDYDTWLQSGDPGAGDSTCPLCGEAFIEEQINWFWRRETGGQLHGIHDCESCGNTLHVYDHEGEPEAQPCGCGPEYHLADCPLNPYTPRDRDGAPVMEGMTSDDYLDLLERLDRRGYDIDDPAHPLFGG